jgi:hypothetical protein
VQVLYRGSPLERISFPWIAGCALAVENTVEEIEDENKLGEYAGYSCKAAFQIMLFALLLIPVSFLPVLLNCAHLVTCILLAVCSSLFFWQSRKLLLSLSNKDAKRLMFASIMYLPVTFIILLIEKLY